MRRKDRERYKKWPRWDAFTWRRGDRVRIYHAARWRALTSLAVTVAACLRLREEGAR